MPSNFSCLDAVMHTYHTCVNDATATVTSSLEWSYSNTVGRVVDMDRSLLLYVAACVFVAVMLISCVQFALNSSLRYELYETMEIVLSLFTDHLSFVALLINSVLFFGQVLAAMCDLLTQLNPH